LVARAAKLTKLQQEKLSAVLSAAEQRTSARLAVTVVHTSDKYPLYPILYGALAGMAVLGALALLLPWLDLRMGFYIAAGSFVAVSLLFEWMWLRLKFIPKHAKHWESWELAHRSFAARILAQNDRKTGILLFVSMGERYVEVVTDRDVDRHVPQSVWDAIIKDFTTAAKKSRAGDGLIAAVEAATRVLEQHYPKA
jgi:putative membrane protein